MHRARSRSERAHCQILIGARRKTRRPAQQEAACEVAAVPLEAVEGAPDGPERSRSSQAPRVGSLRPSRPLPCQSPFLPPQVQSISRVLSGVRLASQVRLRLDLVVAEAEPVLMDYVQHPQRQGGPVHGQYTIRPLTTLPHR